MPQFSRRRMLELMAVSAAAASSPRISQAQPASATPAKIRLLITPIPNYTALLVARDKGWFDEEKLTVSWMPVAQTGIAVEAVYGGSVELGGGGILEPMVARGNGLDMMLFAPAARTRRQIPDNSAILVRADSDIRTVKDLTGKKASVGLINSINYIHMQAWLKNKGVDPKSVSFFEIPFPQMMDALFQNRLDAVWGVEPFMTLMLKTGKARILGYPYIDNLAGMDVSALFGKESWLKANADVARRFRRAFQRGNEFLISGPKEETDGWHAKFTGLKPELVAQVTLPEFSNEFNLASLKGNLDLAVEQKLVKPFDIASMIWKP
jgi:NitT/TauT family transport system substrate-binding protein